MTFKPSKDEMADLERQSMPSSVTGYMSLSCIKSLCEPLKPGHSGYTACVSRSPSNDCLEPQDPDYRHVKVKITIEPDDVFMRLWRSMSNDERRLYGQYRSGNATPEGMAYLLKGYTAQADDLRRLIDLMTKTLEDMHD